jgi:Amino acid permease
MRSVSPVQVTCRAKPQLDALTHPPTASPSPCPHLLVSSLSPFSTLCIASIANLSSPPQQPRHPSLRPHLGLHAPLRYPSRPYTLKWAMTVLVILAPPAGDAFNFVVDLNSYPQAFFYFLMALRLYFVRYQQKNLGLPRLMGKEGGFRAWEVAVLSTIAVNLYLLVMPWYPPPGGATGRDVGFWYATYVVTGIGMWVFPKQHESESCLLTTVISSQSPRLCSLLRPLGLDPASLRPVPDPARKAGARGRRGDAQVDQGTVG